MTTTTATTPMERLQGLHADITRDRHIDLPIPGYNGQLIARYKPIDWREIRRITRRASEQAGGDLATAELYAAASLVVTACERIFFCQEGGDPVPLEEAIEEFGDHPVRFDDQLAKVVGVESETARECVIGVFGNDIALIEHHAEVLAWLRGSEEDAAEGF